ncbi:MAG TPA: hypothetical protein VG426_11520, partial [Candidatus Dormibacteraeota bacterium]|nr:hypothetical protein [Candidatus Dormibacteraeota bacterium]
SGWSPSKSMTNHGGGSRPSRYSSSRIAPPGIAIQEDVAIPGQVSDAEADAIRVHWDFAPAVATT